MLNKHIKYIVLIALFLASYYIAKCFFTIPETLFFEAPAFFLILFCLIKSADIFTDSAAELGARLGLNKLATGVLIIAIGTSGPELFSSIGAAIEKHPEMVIGNIYGSVICNCLLGIGLPAVFANKQLAVHKDVFGTQMSVFLAGIIITGVGLYNGPMSVLESIIMLSILVYYLRCIIKKSKNIDIEIEKSVSANNESIFLLMITLSISLLFLFMSGDSIVTSLSNCAKILDISSSKLATSILAIGTSVPEIATALILVHKNNIDGLFGEIIGSNIFNMLGIFGITSLLIPLTMNSFLLVFLIISTFLSFLILHIMMNDRQINRLEGVVLVFLFVIFIMKLINI